MSDYPVIPEAPAVPIRKEAKEDFSRKASVFIGWVPTFRAAVNDAGAWIQSAVATVFGYKQDAEQAKADAEQAVTDAQGHANQAMAFAEDSGTYALESEGYAQQANSYAQLAQALAGFVGDWSELTGDLDIPASTYHGGAYWVLLRYVADVTLSEPGVSSDWAPIDVDDTQGWQTISASATLEGGRRYAVDFSPSMVLTLPASPATNATIDLYRRSGNPRGCVIARNGKTIMGASENMTIDTPITGLSLIYTGTDWRLK